MGVKVYWWLVCAVILLGLILPQNGYYKKTYIICMALLHSFVSGFRYMYLTGDLRNYAADYYDFVNLGWFDKHVFQDGKNVGFQWLMKFISGISNGDFQVLLLLISVLIEIGLAIVIYKYSPKPWLSYLVWNCMGFYVFGFSAIKQALAMGLLMFAVDAILQQKPLKYLFFVALAGFIHIPALIFLPAYYLCSLHFNTRVLIGYILLAAGIFLSRNSIVSSLSDLYYEETVFANMDTVLGGRFFLIVIILATGLLLKGFRNRNFEKLFHLISVAAILQMFSGFDNVFTRLADYYFQFAILFIPMIFFESKDNFTINKNARYPLLYFNERSLKILVALLVLILAWWYYRTCLGTTIAYEADNYLNFRFMWNAIK